jgi:hypothetical protein
MMTMCAICSEALIAPDWSEFVSERLVINLWSCTKCGDRFETVARMPADAAPKMSEKDWEAMFPPLSPWHETYLNIGRRSLMETSAPEKVAGA